jgi:hypothetical protein
MTVSIFHRNSLITLQAEAVRRTVFVHAYLDVDTVDPNRLPRSPEKVLAIRFTGRASHDGFLSTCTAPYLTHQPASDITAVIFAMACSRDRSCTMNALPHRMFPLALLKSAVR